MPGFMFQFGFTWPGHTFWESKFFVTASAGLGSALNQLCFVSPSFWHLFWDFPWGSQ